eukprot:scaffold63649_cov60-Phaeocystis_antarctica.AAC.3
MGIEGAGTVVRIQRMSGCALAEENPTVWRKTLRSVRDEAGCAGGEEEHATAQRGPTVALCALGALGRESAGRRVNGQAFTPLSAARERQR